MSCSWLPDTSVPSFSVSAALAAPFPFCSPLSASPFALRAGGDASSSPRPLRTGTMWHARNRRTSDALRWRRWRSWADSSSACVGVESSPVSVQNRVMLSWNAFRSRYARTSSRISQPTVSMSGQSTTSPRNSTTPSSHSRAIQPPTSTGKRPISKPRMLLNRTTLSGRALAPRAPPRPPNESFACLGARPSLVFFLRSISTRSPACR